MITPFPLIVVLFILLLVLLLIHFVVNENFKPMSIPKRVRGLIKISMNIYYFVSVSWKSLLHRTDTKLVFLRIFSDCMVKANNRVATDERLANSLRNKAQNWLLEYMASLKSVKFLQEVGQAHYLYDFLRKW